MCILAAVSNHDHLLRRKNAAFVPLRVSATHPAVSNETRNEPSDDDDDVDESDEEEEEDEEEDASVDEPVCIGCHLNKFFTTSLFLFV